MMALGMQAVQPTCRWPGTGPPGRAVSSTRRWAIARNCGAIRDTRSTFSKRCAGPSSSSQQKEPLMQPILGRISAQCYALLRIVAGFLFMFHGAQKVLGMFGGQSMAVGSMPWIAGAIEIVCGLLIMIGLLTSLAAFIASGEMAAAYFMAHQPKDTWPIQNGGELAVLYCFIFLYIASRGSGIWGVDRAAKI